MYTGNKKFKIVYVFGEGDYLPISEDELVKALVLFMEGGRAVFANGAVRSQDISRIVPDWHAVKGWNRGWKMTPDDYEDVKSLEKPYQKTYEQASFIAEFIIKEDRRQLLNKSLKELVELLPAPNKEMEQFSGEVKKLANKFQI